MICTRETVAAAGGVFKRAKPQHTLVRRAPFTVESLAGALELEILYRVPEIIPDGQALSLAPQSGKP
jgi:hypothetical protein